MAACPGCGKNYSSPPLRSKCDTCGCAFCFDGNCTGTIGEAKWPKVGLDEILAELVQNVLRENYKEFKPEH